MTSTCSLQLTSGSESLEVGVDNFDLGLGLLLPRNVEDTRNMTNPHGKEDWVGVHRKG